MPRCASSSSPGGLNTLACHAMACRSTSRMPFFHRTEERVNSCSPACLSSASFRRGGPCAAASPPGASPPSGGCSWPGNKRTTTTITPHRGYHNPPHDYRHHHHLLQHHHHPRMVTTIPSWLPPPRNSHCLGTHHTPYMDTPGGEAGEVGIVTSCLQ